MNTIYKIFACIFFFTLLACSDDDEPKVDPTAELIEVSSLEVPNTDTKVVMYLKKEQVLEVGYNEFSLALKNKAGDIIENSKLTLIPKMSGETMNHNAPFEEMKESVKGLHDFGVVFVMPSGNMGAWKLMVDVKDMDNDSEGQIELPVSIANPEIARMKMIDRGEKGTLIVSLLSRVKPEVGSNDFELTLHRKESMMSWPAIENYTIEITPEMPAMGHGSPNNENPEHKEKGHYLGKVNFTMTGEWVVKVDIKDENGEVIPTTSFTITL